MRPTWLVLWLASRLVLLVLVADFLSGPVNAEEPSAAGTSPKKPNIVLVMADDQGWGQTSYNGHPRLKTPNLDAMAEAGLCFHRFYAAAPVCSPTRASVLTGRTNMRTGVESHGYALRLQEKTLSGALRQAGYATGHFGKWHLNGMRGPGVPLFASDSHHPGRFGFSKWLSVTNFFDRDPILSRMGSFESFEGDSSEIAVSEALQFIEVQAARQKPFLAVIWFGTPHSPFRAADADAAPFAGLDRASQQHYGELVAMDRSIGTLRKGLRNLDIADNTLVWFCSDNGGLPKIKPATVGGLRGHKGSLYEGGLRVPGIVEWPGNVKQRTTQYPAVVMDIFPTIAQIVGLADDVAIQPQDGISLLDVFRGSEGERSKLIPFQCFGNTAIIDNQWKLIELRQRNKPPRLELYDLSSDSQERRNLYGTETERSGRMLEQLRGVQASIAASYAGSDYPNREVNSENPAPRFWTDVQAYRPFFDQWRVRPEYKSRLAKEPAR